MTDNSENNVIIGSRLREARRAAGVSQHEMAMSCGVAKNHLSEIERGNYRCTVQLLTGYCERLGVTPNELLGYDASEDSVDRELLNALYGMGPDGQKRVIELLKLIRWWP